MAREGVVGVRRVPAAQRTRAVHPLLVACGLAAGPAIALGLARFAYGLILPGMRADLHWSFARAGAMNTANALGYLAGAMVTPRIATQLGRRTAMLAAVAVVDAVLLASALTGDFTTLLGLRAVAGVAGAVVFIVGMDLTAWLGHTLSRARAVVLLGVFVGGAGLGIVLSGLAVPPILAHTSTGAGWRLGWLALAVVSVAATPAVRAAAAHVDAPDVTGHRPGGGFDTRRFLPAVVSYGLFGVGYISYVTFIVALLVERRLGGAVVGAFWVVLGLASVLSVPPWGRALGRLHGGRGPAVVLAVVGVGAVLPLLGSGAWLALASAVIFGCGFLAVVTAVTAVARQALPPPQWGPAIAAMTVVFAAGQCAGPLLTGVLSDVAGGVRVGLGISAVVLGAAALIALAQAAPEAR